jgi:hypothetical protein
LPARAGLAGGLAFGDIAFGGIAFGGIGDSVTGYGTSGKLSLGSLAVAGAMTFAMAFFLSGCSDINYPAIHDMPAARAETPLTPDQVKQATDNLICEREHLTSGTQPSAQPGAAANPPGKAPSSCPPAAPQTTGSVPVTPSAYARP